MARRLTREELLPALRAWAYLSGHGGELAGSLQDALGWLRALWEEDHDAPENRQSPVVTVPPKIAPACDARVDGRLTGERPAESAEAADTVTMYGPQLVATSSSGWIPEVRATAVASPQPSGSRASAGGSLEGPPCGRFTKVAPLPDEVATAWVAKPSGATGGTMSVTTAAGCGPTSGVQPDP